MLRYACIIPERPPILNEARVRPDAMKDEYDFSEAERGRFCRPDTILAPPVHLDPDVLAFLTARAAARGASLSELVNALLRKDIELIKAAENL